MPTTEALIWEALRGRVESLPLSLPIAWPGSVYEPGAGDWLAVGRTTQPPRRMLIARGPHDRIGTLTIAYCALIGGDSSWYEKRAGLIAAHFPEDLLLPFGGLTVRIREASHVQEGYRDGGWWRVPVNVKWACLA